MATNIDERVVEMRFDNKQFEDGVKQSMKSLKTLDDTINKMDKDTNLDEMSKKLNNINFEGMESSLKSLEKRFSTFGIAGMTVIQDLTKTAEKLFSTFTNFLKKPLSIAKSGGWARALNIEDAKFQLKGLGVAWEDVSEDIEYAVSGTAYGLDAAAKAASQLTASGVELGDSMKTALRGISGVAAMTNSSYEEISPIFTTIAGQGKLMTMQLRQLEARGLNAAAELANQFGVTEAELREMVTRGEVYFEDFAYAMDSAFGDHAKDANATFTGALGNMQFALKKIGADISEEILHDYVDVFNDVRLAINDLHTALGPIIEEINNWIYISSLVLRVIVKWIRESGVLTTVINNLSVAFKAVSRFVSDFIVNAASIGGPILSAFGALGEAIREFVSLFINLGANISPVNAILLVLQNVIKAIASGLYLIVSLAAELIKTIARNPIVQKIIATLKPFAGVIIPAIVAGLILSKLHLLGIAAAIAAVAGIVAALVAFDIPGKIASVVKWLKEMGSVIYEHVKPALDGIATVFNFIKDGIVNLVKSFASAIKGIISASDSLNDLSDDAGESLNIFQRLGLYIKTGFTNIVKKAQAVLEPFSAWFKEFAANLNLAELSVLGISAAFGAAALLIAKAMENLTKSMIMWNPLTWISKIVTGVKTAMINFSKADLYKSFGVAMLGVATAILALTAAIAGLAFVLNKDMPAFWAAVSVMGAFVVAAGVFNIIIVKLQTQMYKASATINSFAPAALHLANSIEQLGKAAKYAAIGGMLISLAVAIGVLATSLVILTAAAGANPSGFAYGLIAVISVLGLLAVLANTMENVDLSNIIDLMKSFLMFSGTLAVFAVAITVVANTISKINNIEIEDWGKFFLNLLTVLGTLIVLTVPIGLAIKLLSKELANIIQAFSGLGWGLLAFVAALWLLPSVIESAGKAFEAMSKGAKYVGDKLSELFGGINGMIILTGAVVAGLILLSGFADNVVETLSIISGLLLNFKLFLDLLVNIGSDNSKIAALQASFNAVFGIMVMFTAMIGTILGMSSKAGNAHKAAFMFLTIGAMVAIIFGAMKEMFNLGASLAKEGDNSAIIGGVLGVIAGLAALIGAIAIIIKLVSGQNFQGSWKSMLGLSTLIVALTGAISLISILAKNNPLGVITAAASIALAFFGISTVISQFGQSIKLKDITKATVGITAVGASTAAIAGVLAGMMHYFGVDPSMMIASVLSLGVLIGVLAFVFDKLASSFTSYSWSKIGQIVVGMTGIAISLIPAAIALTLLAGYDWNSIWPGLAALSVVLAEFTGVLIVLGAISRSGGAGTAGTIIATAAAMLIMSTSMIAMAYGISMIADAVKDMDVDKMSSMFASIEILTGILSVVIVILGALGAAVPEVSLVLLALGVAFVGIGAAALGAGVGVMLIAKAFDQLCDTLSTKGRSTGVGLAGLGKGIMSFGTSMAKMITNIVTEISNQIVISLQYGHKAAEEVIEILKSLIKGLGELLGSFIDGMTSAGVAIVRQIGTIGSTAISTITVLIAQIALTLDYGGRLLAQGAYDAITRTALAARMAFEDAKTILFGELEDVGKWVPMSFMQGVSEKSDEVYEAAAAIGNASIEGLRDATDIHSPSEIIEGIGGWFGISFDRGMLSTVDTIFDGGFSLGESATNGLKDGADGGAGAKNLIAEFITGLSNNQGSMNAAAENSGKQAGFAWTKGLEEVIAGAKGIMDSNSGFTSGLTDAEKQEAKDWAASALKDDVVYANTLKRLKKQYGNNFKEYRDELKNVREERLKYLTTIREEDIQSKKNQQSTYNLTKTLEDLLGITKNENTETKDATEYLEDFADVADYTTDTLSGSGGLSDAISDTTSYYDEMSDSIANAMDVFNGFDKSVTTTKEDLIKNMNDMITGVKSWRTGILAMIDRGFNADLIQQLYEMGPQSSYGYIQAFLEMSPAEVKKYNAKYERALKVPDVVVKNLEKYFNEDGTLCAEAFAEGVGSLGLSDWKMPTDEIVDETVAAEDAYYDLFKFFTRGSTGSAKTYKAMGNGLDDLFDSLVQFSSRAAKTTRQGVKDVYAEMYLGAKSEDELLDMMTWTEEERLADFKAFWDEMREAVEESVTSQMRSMDDLSAAYTQTGADLQNAWAKQNSDYNELMSDKYFLSGILDTMDKPQNAFAEYIRDSASESEILSLIQGYTENFATGGREAAEAWLLEMSRTWKGKGAVDNWATLIEAYNVALEMDDESALKAISAQMEASISSIKTYKEIFTEAVEGIKDGIKNLTTDNKTLAKMSKRITTAFAGMSKAINAGSLSVGEAAIRNYALSLIDFNEVLEESKVLGVEVSDIVETRIEDVTNALLSFRNSVESNLKGSLQSFSKFDKGEEQTFEELQENLRSNITALNEWRANIRKLQAKGYSQAIIEELTSQGVSSSSIIEALVDSTVDSAGVDSINQMWEQIGIQTEIAADEATGAMMIAGQTAGTDTTDAMITAILDEAVENTSTVVDAFTDVGDAAISGLEAANMNEEAEDIISELCQTIADALLDSENLQKIRASGLEVGRKTTHYIRYGIEETEEKTENKAMHLGRLVMNGAMKGLKEKKSRLFEVIDDIIHDALAHAEDELDIHSPSRKTEWMGNMLVEGMVNGLDGSSYEIMNEMVGFVEEMEAYAEEAANEIQGYWSNIGDDTVVKPVLDLDNLQNARSLIADALSGDQTIALQSKKLASDAAVVGNNYSQLQQLLNGLGGSTTNTTNYGDTQIVVNAPEGADENQIAEMVMVKIQQRIDRRKYV